MSTDPREARLLLAPPEATAFPACPDWAKPLTDASSRFSGEFLKFLASGLRTQAEFLDGLANCKDLADVFQLQSTFMQNSWELCLTGAAHLSKITPDNSVFARSPL
ncbi:phasin family protein [Pseudoroseomonas sp. WGS1072]|uniref:phasin family protein n=1 Tax=Roseomonas sp. WGS1072 TaxID=3366816 RepID=UPI003BF34A3E